MKFSASVAVAYAAFLFLSVSAFEIPPEMKEILEAAHSECKAETGVADDVVAQAMKGVLADDPKLKCFMKCVFQRLQAMREDGSLDLDLIEASMPEELKAAGAMESLKKCMSLSESDLCVRAYEIVKCSRSENPKLAEYFSK